MADDTKTREIEAVAAQIVQLALPLLAFGGYRPAELALEKAAATLKRHCITGAIP
jgi:hypothetical protein